MARQLRAGRISETLQQTVDALRQADQAGEWTQLDDGSYRVTFIPHTHLTEEEQEAQELNKEREMFIRDMENMRKAISNEKRLQADALLLGVDYIPWAAQQQLEMSSSGRQKIWSEKPARFQGQNENAVVHGQQVQPWPSNRPRPLAGAPTEIIRFD